MEHIAKSMLETCIFTNDPIIGGIPMIECIYTNDGEQMGGNAGFEKKDDIGLEQFNEFVIPIGLFLNTVNVNSIVTVDAYDEDEVISSNMFDRLFDAVNHSGSSSTTRRERRASSARREKSARSTRRKREEKEVELEEQS